ncbi:hypothetical protein EYF80_058945 [Liparis tanakae]|uniref:Uncharacterized protein n=1 Tax=Liparis tanakae TaxID=230148 RepID=A0A4Z2EQ32_9TELE|nr:hypothetical protein EYF80_058945 [Liparis tanakae]
MKFAQGPLCRDRGPRGGCPKRPVNVEEEEEEEEEEDAGEGVGGGGEVWRGDEALGEGLPLLARLWRLDEALAPTTRGIWLGGWCSPPPPPPPPPPPLLGPHDRLTPPPPPRVKDSEEEDAPSGHLEDRDGTALCLPEPGHWVGPWPSWVGGASEAWADAAEVAQDKSEGAGAGVGVGLGAVECARTPWQWRSSLAACRSEAGGRPCREGWRWGRCWLQGSPPSAAPTPRAALRSLEASMLLPGPDHRPG